MEHGPTSDADNFPKGKVLLSIGLVLIFFRIGLILEEYSSGPVLFRIVLVFLCTGSTLLSVGLVFISTGPVLFIIGLVLVKYSSELVIGAKPACSICYPFSKPYCYPGVPCTTLVNICEESKKKLAVWDLSQAAQLVGAG